VYLAPKFRGAGSSEVVGPRHVEHLLKGDGCNLEEVANASVGVGNDCPAFLPILLPFHHDVAIWERLVVVEEFFVVFVDLCWSLAFHVVLDLLVGCVKHDEGGFVHPCVDRCLVVDVWTIDHQAGVGVVFVVYNEVVRYHGYHVLDELVVESWMFLDLRCVTLPLLVAELLKFVNNLLVRRELMMFSQCLNAVVCCSMIRRLDE